MFDLDPEKKKLLYYGLTGFAIILLLLRGCALAEHERMMKYVHFHQDNFAKLCSENYEELVPEVRSQCNQYFESIGSEPF